jgi:2-haloacid dehalogenase
MAYKFLIFDLDETQMSFQKAEEVALDKTMEVFFEEDLRSQARKAYHPISKSLWQALEDGRLDSPGNINNLRFKKLLETMPHRGHYKDAAQFFWQVLGEQRHLMEGVEELLPNLHGSYHLSILTNGIKKIQHRRIESSILEGVFTLINNSETLGVSKPDPRIFSLHLEQLGNPSKEEVLMIGDSLKSDMAGAKAAGIPCCWYNWQKSPLPSQNPPDYHIHHWREFIPLLNSSL